MPSPHARPIHLFLAALALLLGAGCTDEPTPGADDLTGEDACQLGQRECKDERTLRTCTINAGQTRYVEVACALEESCQNGDCVRQDRSCEDRCTPPQTRCSAEGAETCADHDGDGCVEFGAPAPCDTGEICDPTDGLCKASDCTDACTEGQTSCEDALIATCVRGVDGCLGFGAAKECPTNQTCQDGACVAASGCQDECQEDACTADGKRATCADTDSDGCAEFGAPSACGTGQTCRDGACVSENACQDDCASGQTACVNNQITTCQRLTNGCLAFPPPVDCPAGESCSSDSGAATCVAPPASGQVVLNEIFYDALSGDLRNDGGQPETPTYVELHGPGGFDVSGYVLELVDGSDGSTYATITLPQGTLLDGNGFAVIASQTPDRLLSLVVPFFSNVVYELGPYQSGQDGLQDGPDAIRLKNGSGATIDRVAYGAVPTAFAAGEGAPAEDVVAGRSLGRDASSTDTNDNATDWISQLPTPGIPNGDLLINEVYVDQPGADTGSDTFIELVAPVVGPWEDVPLDGYVLHAINGHDGDDYIFSGILPGIEMSLTSLYDGAGTEGYVVVCNLYTASATLLDLCTVPYDGVDFQNGPDSLVLTYEGRVIDAVAYGSFGPGTYAAGEGSPVPFSSANGGKSMARWPLDDASHTLDTDDNATDFHLVDPTPGAPNPLPSP